MHKEKVLLFVEKLKRKNLFTIKFNLEVKEGYNSLLKIFFWEPNLPRWM